MKMSLHHAIYQVRSKNILANICSLMVSQQSHLWKDLPLMMVLLCVENGMV